VRQLLSLTVRGIVTQWPYTELEYAQATERLRDVDWVHRTG